MRKTAGLRSCLAHSNAHMPGRIRRTRKANVDDPVCDEWEIDFVHGRASGRMGKKYLVRWKGFTEKEDTWEPSENLEGAQDLVKKFNDEQDVLEAQDCKDAVERHQQAVTEKRKREEVSTADANARPPPHVCLQERTRLLQDAIHHHNQSASVPSKRRRNESPWWQYFCRKSQDKKSPGTTSSCFLSAAAELNSFHLQITTSHCASSRKVIKMLPLLRHQPSSWTVERSTWRTVHLL